MATARKYEKSFYLETELELFLLHVINSLSKLHILLFLYHNPGLLDTEEGLIKKTGLEKGEAKDSLESLLLSEVVSRHTDNGEVLWFYNPSQRKKGLIEEIVSIYSTPQGKEEILNTLIANYMGMGQRKDLYHVQY